MENKNRICYIDNIRWIVILSVVVFHVVDTFNSTGVKIHFNAPGIKYFDSFAYFVYPWFMAILFVIAGMSAAYSLKTKSPGQFAKGRAARLLIPFAVYMLLFSIPTTAISFTANNGWADFANVPKFVLYPIMMLIGMGHLWFVLELFIVTMLFLLINKLDGKHKLTAWGEKCNIFILLLMYFPLLLGAQFINFLGVFRNLLFLMLFLLGYYVFSHDSVMQTVEKYRIPMGIAALALFVVQMIMYWGQSFSDIVNKPVVMLYTWIMILAVLGNAKAWLNFSNRFTVYMNKRSFLIYLFHYLPMTCIAYYITTVYKFPVLTQYILVLVLTCIVTFAICEFILRVPLIAKIFGIK